MEVARQWEVARKWEVAALALEGSPLGLRESTCANLSSHWSSPWEAGLTVDNCRKSQAFLRVAGLGWARCFRGATDEFEVLRCPGFH